MLESVETAGRPAALLLDRLALVHAWYQGMVSPRTGRLVYRYDPELDTAECDGNPVRDIASVWDLEVLGEMPSDR